MALLHSEMQGHMLNVLLTLNSEMKHRAIY